MIDHDEIREILKKHWLLVSGRREGQRANLTSRDLSGLNLSGVSFQTLIAPGADFSRCTLVETNFTDADLFTANFDNANCEKANFLHADIRGASFNGARLSGVNLEGADMRPGRRFCAVCIVRPDRRHDDRRRPCLRCRFRTGRGTSRDMTQHIQPKPLHDQLAWLGSV